MSNETKAQTKPETVKPKAVDVTKLVEALRAESTTKIVVARELAKVWTKSDDGKRSKSAYVDGIMSQLIANGVELAYDTARQYVVVGDYFPTNVTIGKGANAVDIDDVDFVKLQIAATRSGNRQGAINALTAFYGDQGPAKRTASALRAQLDANKATTPNSAKSGKAARVDLAKIVEMTKATKVDPHYLAVNDDELADYVKALRAEADRAERHLQSKARTSKRAAYVGNGPAKVSKPKPKPKAKPKAQTKANAPKSIRGNRKAS